MKCDKCGSTGILLSRHDILSLRKKKGVTQDAAAKGIGIAASYLCDIEKGNRGWSISLQQKFLSFLKTRRNKKINQRKTK